MGSDKGQVTKALEVKVYSFHLMLQNRVSGWKNAKQKKRVSIKKIQSRKMILPAFRVAFKVAAFSNTQGRYKHDKKALFKVRKKDVEMQNVRVWIGSWVERNVIQKVVKMYI